MRFIGVLIIIGIVAGNTMTIDYKKFIDMPSLLLVLGGAIGYALAKGNPKDFFRNFGDGSVYMGWIGLIIGLIMIGNHYADVEKNWPSYFSSIFTYFYGYLIRLISTGIEKVKNP